MANSDVQDKSLTTQSLLERIADWADTAYRYIGLGAEVINRTSMKLLKFTPEGGYEKLFRNEKQEQDINTCMTSDWNSATQIKHNELCFDQEFREILILEEGLRYYCGRTSSILAAADNLERIARDTRKEFSKI